MTTLAELYNYLEKKRDNEHIDSMLSYEVFLPEEWPKARLEILMWWKMGTGGKVRGCPPWAA